MLGLGSCGANGIGPCTTKARQLCSAGSGSFFIFFFINGNVPPDRLLGACSSLQQAKW
jgi:hypothetical protein